MIESLLKSIHPTQIYSSDELVQLERSRFSEHLEAYQAFLFLYPTKIQIIAAFMRFWDTGTMEEIECNFLRIKEINKKLIEQLKKLVVDTSNARNILGSFFYSMIKKKAREIQDNNPEQSFWQKESALMRYYLVNLNEDLTKLIKLMHRQNRYIEKNNEWKTHEELLNDLGV
ncbi:hypothetical protein HZB02_05995 [Candidatus Woesearchaeota archaeon]|nr:hypothetical protein [Candidatus Woesearchaeota archaeon]